MIGYKLSMTDLRLRQAVRGLMIDPQDRVLLAQLSFADGFEGWILPGGGIDDGETQHQALRRELAEETGVSDPFIGPVLWHRTTLVEGMADGKWDGQYNVTFLVPCHAFEPAPVMSAAELADEGMIGIRWWTVKELSSVTSDVVRPDGLAELVERVLEHGAPPEPWDLGTTVGARRLSN